MNMVMLKLVVGILLALLNCVAGPALEASTDLTENLQQGCHSAKGFQLLKPEKYFDACLNIEKVMSYVDGFPSKGMQHLLVLDICSGKERRLCRAARERGYKAAWFEILLGSEHPIFTLLLVVFFLVL